MARFSYTWQHFLCHFFHSLPCICKSYNSIKNYVQLFQVALIDTSVVKNDHLGRLIDRLIVDDDQNRHGFL